MAAFSGDKNKTNISPLEDSNQSREQSHFNELSRIGERWTLIGMGERRKRDSEKIARCSALSPKAFLKNKRRGSVKNIRKRVAACEPKKKRC